ALVDQLECRRERCNLRAGVAERGALRVAHQDARHPVVPAQLVDTTLDARAVPGTQGRRKRRVAPGDLARDVARPAARVLVEMDRRLLARRDPRVALA